MPEHTFGELIAGNLHAAATLEKEIVFEYCVRLIFVRNDNLVADELKILDTTGPEYGIVEHMEDIVAYDDILVISGGVESLRRE